MNPKVREYPCQVVRVIDGDSAEVELDLGFGVWTKGTLRLFGINAPERGTEGAAEAEARLRLLVGLSGFVYARTHKSREHDKYGRYLVELWRDAEMVGPSINERLVLDGFAVSYPPHPYKEAK